MSDYSQDDGGFRLVILITFFLAIFLLGGFISWATTDEVHDVKINEKEVVIRDTGEDQVHVYLIFTDKGVFENTDTLWKLKFNSSDYYNQIKIGKCYDFQVNGYRSNLLSRYQNIIDFKEVKCQKE